MSQVTPHEEALSSSGGSSVARRGCVRCREGFVTSSKALQFNCVRTLGSGV